MSIESAKRRSSVKGSVSLKSPNSESGLVSQTQCSAAYSRNLPMKPTDVISTRGMSSSLQQEHSCTAKESVIWHATTSENGLKNSTPLAITAAGSLSRCSPWTSGFISWSHLHVDSARDLPTSFSSRKKLLPRSAASTLALSMTVKRPMPGSTRFLRVSVAQGEEPSMQIRASMSAFCPCAPHSRSCRSYLSSVAMCLRREPPLPGAPGSQQRLRP
mmetsp:Transcript_66344/g.154146  ORF Transcript_66344/g.154146 Transcript_66344/m.154146 type:complete len:216 (-) Transcript_66344:7-654(-)